MMGMREKVYKNSPMARCNSTRLFCTVYAVIFVPLIMSHTGWAGSTLSAPLLPISDSFRKHTEIVFESVFVQPYCPYEMGKTRMLDSLADACIEQKDGNIMVSRGKRSMCLEHITFDEWAKYMCIIFCPYNTDDNPLSHIQLLEIMQFASIVVRKECLKYMRHFFMNITNGFLKLDRIPTSVCEEVGVRCIPGYIFKVCLQTLSKVSSVDQENIENTLFTHHLTTAFMPEIPLQHMAHYIRTFFFFVYGCKERTIELVSGSIQAIIGEEELLWLNKARPYRFIFPGSWETIGYFTFDEHGVMKVVDSFDQNNMFMKLLVTDHMLRKFRNLVALPDRKTEIVIRSEFWNAVSNGPHVNEESIIEKMQKMSNLASYDYFLEFQNETWPGTIPLNWSDPELVMLTLLTNRTVYWGKRYYYELYSLTQLRISSSVLVSANSFWMLYSLKDLQELSISQDIEDWVNSDFLKLYGKNGLVSENLAHLNYDDENINCEILQVIINIPRLTSLGLALFRVSETINWDFLYRGQLRKLAIVDKYPETWNNVSQEFFRSLFEHSRLEALSFEHSLSAFNRMQESFSHDSFLFLTLHRLSFSFILPPFEFFHTLRAGSIDTFKAFCNLKEISFRASSRKRYEGAFDIASDRHKRAAFIPTLQLLTLHLSYSTIFDAIHVLLRSPNVEHLWVFCHEPENDFERGQLLQLLLTVTRMRKVRKVVLGIHNKEEDIFNCDLDIHIFPRFLKTMPDSVFGRVIIRPGSCFYYFPHKIQLKLPTRFHASGPLDLYPGMSMEN